MDHRRLELEESIAKNRMKIDSLTSLRSTGKVIKSESDLAMLSSSSQVFGSLVHGGGIQTALQKWATELINEERSRLEQKLNDLKSQSEKL
jgi:hypothetical protein